MSVQYSKGGLARLAWRSPFLYFDASAPATVLPIPPAVRALETGDVGLRVVPGLGSRVARLRLLGVIRRAGLV